MDKIFTSIFNSFVLSQLKIRLKFNIERFIYAGIIALMSLLIGGYGVLEAQTPGGGGRPTASPFTLPAAYGDTAVNYIRTWTSSAPTTDPAFIISPSGTTQEVKQITQYFDRLGRLMQTVNKAISPGGKDMVTPVVYDDFGREQFKYLPYIPQTGNTSDGSFRPNFAPAQKAFYDAVPGTTGENVYYSRIDYEASPLNRVLKTYAPGASWAKNDLSTTERGGNHPIENQYLLNTVADSVRIWDIGAYAGLPTSSGFYSAAQLYKNVTIDEAGNQTIEYKDIENKVVLKKVQISPSPGTAHIGWQCTYYVYDDLGNLRFVIPPLATEKILGSWNVASVAAELCFQYRYDGLNRMIIKKIPGADSVMMVYDVRDRLVFSQDGNMKGKVWMAVFYDNLNRPVMTALYRNSGATRESLQAAMNSATGSSSQTINYTFPAMANLVLDNYDGKSLYEATNSIEIIDGFSTNAGSEVTLQINANATSGSSTVLASNALPGILRDSLTPLTYTYYDDYSFTGSQSYANGDISKPQADGSPNAEPLPATPSSLTKGLVTGTKVRVLGTNQWLTSTNYYNDKGRLIQAISDNTSGGLDVLTSLYDFEGKVLSTYHRHKNMRSVTAPQTTVLTMMAYDAAGRLRSVKKRLNDASANQDKVVVINA